MNIIAINRIKEAYRSLVETVKDSINNIREHYGSDTRKKTRALIIAFAIMFIFDYAVVSYHIEKNVFDIFPSFPLLQKRTRITVYLPSLDGENLLKEVRKVPVYEDEKQFARFLCYQVMKGSTFENTAVMVPMDLFIRKIWIYEEDGQGKVCVFDMEPETLNDNTSVISNSESLFREALEKTVSANISSISRVMVLEKGIPGKPVWEVPATARLR